MIKQPPAQSRVKPLLLGGAVFLAPPLLAFLLVEAYQHLRPPSDAALPSATASLTNRLSSAASADLGELLSLRRDARNQGQPTDEVDLRIWAACAAKPAELFRVRPPEGDGSAWKWHLSQDGRFAVAVSGSPEATGLLRAGLFDLVANEWVWKNVLPWPDRHESPYVFNRHLVLRYVKRATRFALEISPDGHIASLDALGKGADFAPPAPPAKSPLYPGVPVALKNGVFFVSDPDRHDLVGYPLERMPGLRYAGTADANTLFSGNGRLKFTLSNGALTVADSLTLTPLQRLQVWKPATNVAVTGALTTLDGSSLSVFLRADFGGPVPVSREWSVAIATYSGTVLPSFNADALLAKPRLAAQKQAASRDGRWLLTVTPANELRISAAQDKRPIAGAALTPVLGSARSVDHIAFLEDDRHVVIRQGTNVWLLDFTLARGYAGLLTRLTSAAEAASAKATRPVETNTPPSVVEATLGEASSAEPEPWPEAPPSAPLALRAEQCAAHQSWPYAAALLEACAAYSTLDARAPRVNPLLFARAELLSGQKQRARLICSRALQDLIADPSHYNRMAKYHLQGLLFSQP